MRDPWRSADEEQERAWSVLISILCLVVIAGCMFVLGYSAWWVWVYITTDLP